MKKIKTVLIIIILSFSSNIIAQYYVQLTFRFNNIEVISGPPDILQFDIEAKAEIEGNFIYDLQVILEYDTLGFGTNIVANNKITVNQLNLLGGYYSIFKKDSRKNRIAIKMYETSNPLINPIFTDFEGLIQIQLEITDINHIEGIRLVEDLMDGGQITSLNPTSSFFLCSQDVYEYYLDIQLKLEGPFDLPEMNTLLNQNGIIPLAQPYNIPPWNYPGTESVAFIPNSDIVDWVLIESRDADNAINASGGTTFDLQAAFLLKNGSIVGMDGISKLPFTHRINQNLFIIIRHRNHLSVISSLPPSLSLGNYAYDFSSSQFAVLGGSEGHKELQPGIWGMFGGDANADGLITQEDKSINWFNSAGFKGYLDSDFNMDTQVNNSDKNDIWYFNLYKSTQIPE